MKRVLSLDGGGVFGIGQAEILCNIKTLDKFDAIVGTSIGAVVGAMVAGGDSVVRENIPKFFDTVMPNIFSGYSWRRFNPWTPRYNDKELNKALQTLLPGFLKDVKIPLFITAADLNKRVLKVYFSGDVQDGNMPLWEVARQAVAAETYMCPYNGFADAGIYANNPVMVGISGACSEFGYEPENLAICSIGTGQTSYNKPVGTTNGWTLIGWGAYLVPALLSGAASGMHEFFAQRLGLQQYLRIQFMRDDDWAMDDARLVDVARKKWASEIKAAIPKVEAF